MSGHHPSILLQIKEARMGVGKSGAGGVQPQHFNELSLNPLICVLLPVIEVGWVGGGHVQKAEVWLRASCLFILICLVCLTGGVTGFKVYELSESWAAACCSQNVSVCGCVCERECLLCKRYSTITSSCFTDSPRSHLQHICCSILMTCSMIYVSDISPISYKSTHLPVRLKVYFMLSYVTAPSYVSC